MIKITGYNYGVEPFAYTLISGSTDSTKPHDRISGSIDFITDDINILNSLRVNGFNDIYPGNVIVKCKHCGQWCARKTACVYCGAPVD